MTTSTVTRLRLLPALILATITGASFVVSGCKDSDPVATGSVDPTHTPTMLTRDVETLISDSGVTRYRIVTPIWYVYDETPEPFWRFPEGLKLERYDNFFRIEATVTADSATYFKNKQLWRLDGNVSLTNVMNEKFQTNQLFWDQRQEKLYSDSFIHIERPDKVLEGYGFDSNQNLTRYTIRRVSGIFPAGAFTPGGNSSAQAPKAPQPAADTLPAASRPSGAKPDRNTAAPKMQIQQPPQQKVSASTSESLQTQTTRF